MAKVVKSLEELRDMVEAEVRKYSDFNDVTPLSAYWHERDQDGCNWNVAHWNGPKELVSMAAAAVGAQVMQYRLTFDAPGPAP